MKTRLTLILAISAMLAIGLAGGAMGKDLEPGQQAPDFTLTDTAGHAHTLSDYTKDGQIVVLEWFNPDCPFIKKHHATAKTMNALQQEYADRGVVWLAINSNAPGKQGSGLERNRKAHAEYEMTFPILLDESGEVGQAYGAKTTPHMFVIDEAGVVRYAGAIDSDSSWDKMGEVNYVEEALQAVLKGDEVETTTSKPYGCSVKYPS